MNQERTKINECYRCVHKRNTPGDAHIACNNPDPDMTGNPHGIKNGCSGTHCYLIQCGRKKIVLILRRRNNANTTSGGMQDMRPSFHGE